MAELDISDEVIEATAEAICEDSRSVWDVPYSGTRYTTSPSYVDLTEETKNWYRAMARAASPLLAEQGRRLEQEKNVARLETLALDYEDLAAARAEAGHEIMAHDYRSKARLLRALIAEAEEPSAG